MSEWMSIKNRSPLKNEKEFLGYENGNIFVFSWRMDHWHECSQSEIAYEVNPTHWMPLPEPPNEITNFSRSQHDETIRSMWRPTPLKE